MLTIDNLNDKLDELNAEQLEVVLELIEEAIEAEFARQ